MATLTLDYFPAELLVEVFSKLDYITINMKLRPVCRRFNFIIEAAKHSSLSKPLFLHKETPPALDDDADINYEEYSKEYCFAMHPCLRKLVVDFSQDYLSISNVGFMNSQTNTLVPLEGTNLASENALLFLGTADSILSPGQMAPELPFAIVIGPKTMNLTVLDIVRTLLNSARVIADEWPWLIDDEDKKNVLVPLLHDYGVMLETNFLSNRKNLFGRSCAFSWNTLWEKGTRPSTVGRIVYEVEGAVG